MDPYTQYIKKYFDDYLSPDQEWLYSCEIKYLEQKNTQVKQLLKLINAIIDNYDVATIEALFTALKYKKIINNDMQKIKKAIDMRTKFKRIF